MIKKIIITIIIIIIIIYYAKNKIENIKQIQNEIINKVSK